MAAPIQSATSRATMPAMIVTGDCTAERSILRPSFSVEPMMPLTSRRIPMLTA
jgi:hypothetical protein